MTPSKNKSIVSGIPQVDAVLPLYRLLAPAGFLLAFNLSIRGAEVLHSEYPDEWQREYERANYIWADPVLLWCAVNTGQRRWSEVKFPDMMGVMPAASRHGLHYGAIFCRKHNGRKSVLSVAHDSREFTDDEIAILARSFDGLVTEVKIQSSLTEGELETLRCVQQGLEYTEIAEQLGIAVPTVKARLEKARTKLGAKNTPQAIAIAIRRNLI
jgi:LuxR family transcriptional regulator